MAIILYLQTTKATTGDASQISVEPPKGEVIEEIRLEGPRKVIP